MTSEVHHDERDVGVGGAGAGPAVFGDAECSRSRSRTAVGVGETRGPTAQSGGQEGKDKKASLRMGECSVPPPSSQLDYTGFTNYPYLSVPISSLTWG